MVVDLKKTNLSSENAMFKAELLMVSDVHLRGPDDVRCRLLCDVVDRAMSGSVKTFLLLGDIFDFCIGGPKFYRQKYQVLSGKLEDLAASEGNHEFSMTAMRWKGVEVVQSEAMMLECGAKIAIRHGDLLNAPKSYRLFRWALKSRMIRGIAAAIPATVMESYALSHAKISRSRDQYRHLDHSGLMAAANVWLQETSALHGIFGHFHVPYAEPREAGAGKILSVSSWDDPNFLIFNAGKFSRGIFDQSTLEWRFEDIKSFFVK